jgi:hypothetical protein
VKTEIFLQRGLDTPVDKPPDGQISLIRFDKFAAARKSEGRARAPSPGSGQQRNSEAHGAALSRHHPSPEPAALAKTIV